MKIINVNLKENPYNIYIACDILVKLPSFIENLKLGNLGIIITSPQIASLYKSIFRKIFKPPLYKVILTADGEKVKSKEWLFKIIDEILKADNLGKTIFLICLGGGTIGDVGGFIASIYKRGIPYINVPTTLLAQIDAGIGGKTAIDLNQAKNILGTIYQPKAVFIDPHFLKTLPLRNIKEGIAEAIKYGIIKDPDFFYFLKDNHQKITALETEHILNLISTCVGIKAGVVEEDEKETKGIRTILNFGHTLAHALETSSKYTKLSHGEAVSLGMLYASQLSLLLKKCASSTVKEVEDILKIFSLPTKTKIAYNNIYKPFTYDKKFISGKVRMVLVKNIGKIEVANDISLKDIQISLKSFLQ